MPAPLKPKEVVIDLLVDAFRNHGYEGASLSRLSEITGLGKASLYHYFPGGKQDLARAALDHATQRLIDDVLGPLTGPGSPRERLARMADGVRRFYLDGRASCLLDLFGVGEARRVFQDGLAERVGYVMRELARVVAETGVDQAEADVRAEDALIAIQGSLVVSRALDDPAPFLRVVEELPDRLLAGR